MGRYDGILLMSDFDGTLALNGQVSKENSEAINFFQDRGGVFVLSSGRPPHWLKKTKDFFTPTKYSVMLNGTVICDNTETPIIKKYFAPEIFDFVDKEIIPNFPKLDFVRYHTYTAHYDIPLDAQRVPQILSEPIYKLILHTPETYSDKYLAGLTELCRSRYAVSRSWPNGIELQSLGSTKGDAITTLKELYGSCADTVVSVGDYENDISMIKSADIGYAVANAQKAVKEVADRITVDCKDHAIAKIISEL
jgi:Cof subfamily protein (haloacid dehalogenase superfamily)